MKTEDITIYVPGFVVRKIGTQSQQAIGSRQNSMIQAFQCDILGLLRSDHYTKATLINNQINAS